MSDHLTLVSEIRLRQLLVIEAAAKVVVKEYGKIVSGYFNPILDEMLDAIHDLKVAIKEKP